MINIRALRLRHRRKGYGLLSGRGLEIGALHLPAAVPEGCQVEYCDIQPAEEISKSFPELKASSLVAVSHICNLDADGLSPIEERSFDFVILNHVIEHLANPIYALKELFRVTKEGGLVVVSAPDKEYTFDKKRALTPFSHLLQEYNHGVTEVTDEHYTDFLKAVSPGLFDRGEQEIQKALTYARDRREHAHVWDSRTFRQFLDDALELLNIQATCVYETTGKDNFYEYFSVWKKTTGADAQPHRFRPTPTWLDKLALLANRLRYRLGTMRGEF